MLYSEMLKYMYYGVNMRNPEVIERQKIFYFVNIG